MARVITFVFSALEHSACATIRFLFCHMSSKVNTELQDFITLADDTVVIRPGQGLLLAKHSDIWKKTSVCPLF